MSNKIKQILLVAILAVTMAVPTVATSTVETVLDNLAPSQSAYVVTTVWDGYDYAYAVGTVNFGHPKVTCFRLLNEAVRVYAVMESDNSVTMTYYCMGR